MAVTSDLYVEDEVRVLEVHFIGGEVEQLTLKAGDVVEGEDLEEVTVVLASPPGVVHFKVSSMLWWSVRTVIVKKKAAGPHALPLTTSTAV